MERSRSVQTRTWGPSGAIRLGPSGTLKFTGNVVSARAVSLGTNFLIGSANGIDTNGFDVTLSGKLTASGSSLVKNGDGILTLTNNSSDLSGPIVINAGAIASNYMAGGSYFLNGGALRLTAPVLSNSFIYLTSSGGTIDVASGADSIVGAFNDYPGLGIGSLTKTGAGKLASYYSGQGYTGSTTIVGGTWVASLLTNGGANSSVGASSSAAANLVLNGGTLQYTGTGDSTDRQFTLGTNGGTLDASGSGAINFTSTAPVVLSGANTPRTLTLTGSSIAANTLAAAIGDNGSGATSLLKTGNGQWVLSGTSTYTGPTTVNAGTLDVNGSIAGGVTVNSGAIVRAPAQLAEASMSWRAAH